MPECPRCGLINAPEAARCDCGYALGVPAAEQAPELRGRLRPYAAWQVVRAAGWGLIGLAALAAGFAMVYFSGTALGFAFLLLMPWGGGAVVLGGILLAVGSWMKG